MLAPDLTTWLTLALLVWIGWQRGWADRWLGRLGLLLLLSPCLRYLSTVFGFELRLSLSALAGSLLRLGGLGVTVVGNVLTRPGPSGEPLEMSVDPACMGLHLTGVSMLVAAFGLIWFEQQRGRQVSLGWVLAFGLVTFGLTLVCNLVRIVGLVAFSILPHDPLHEIIGLVCVLAYGWLPGLGLAWLTVRYLGQVEKPVGVGFRRFGTGLMFGLLTLLIAGCWAINRPTNPARQGRPAPKPGYHVRLLPSGFIQYDRPGVLIYQKTLPDWWSAEHSPTACWRGSGYDLTHIRQTTLNGHPAYVGELRRGNAILHTAWWFSNGRQCTVGQWDMRTRMLRGEPTFALINVTTDDARRLTELCRDRTGAPASLRLSVRQQ